MLFHQLPARPRLRAERNLPALIAVGLCVVAMSGCAAGITNETSKETPAIQGASVTVGDLFVSDIYITPVGQEASPPAGVSLAPTTDVTESAAPGIDATPSTPIAGYLVATVIDNSNSSPDELLGIQVKGATATPAPATKPFEVQPNGTLHLNDPAASSRGPYILLSAPTTPLQIGTYVPVTFDFEGAGKSTTVQVPVIASDAGAPPASPLGVKLSTTTPASTVTTTPTVIGTASAQ